MKTDLIKAIGLELSDIRRSKEVLLADVADNTHINKDTISKYENGNSSMKIYIIDNLLEYYDVNVVDFFTKVYDRMQKMKLFNETEE